MSYTAGERHWALYETTRNEQMHDWEYRLVRDEHGVGLTLPDHPALPVLAKLLHDPEFAVAVTESIEALQLWIDRLLENGTAADITDAAGLSSSRLVMEQLAAALATKEGGDGNG